MVVQTNDVTGIGLFCLHAIARHEGDGIRDLYLFTGTDVRHTHTLLIATGAHTHKRNSVSVFWIHVCLDFEHKPRELIFFGRNMPILAISTFRRRRMIHKTIQHLLHTKVA